VKKEETTALIIAKNGPTGSQYVWMLCTWRKRGEEDEEEEDR
jgi:hypothetical protein